MNVRLKDNPLACGLLGVIVGAGSTLGGQTLLGVEGRSMQTRFTKAKPENNFDIVPYDEYGDVYITAHGKKYHGEYCYTLDRAKKIQRVSSSDAKAAGLEPCSKCQ